MDLTNPIDFNKMYDSSSIIAVPVSYEKAKKGNVWISVLFITIIIIIIIAMVVLMIWGAVSYKQYQNVQNKLNNLPTCYNISSEFNLIQIPNDMGECRVGTYYIGKLTDGTYDFVVAPWGTTNHNVCVQFCNNFNPETQFCTGVDYLGKSANDNYHACIKQLDGLVTNQDGVPKCNGPVPIAQKGPILYYPQSVTCKSCPICI